MTPNPAMDSDTYPAPLRTPVSARHRERWASMGVKLLIFKSSTRIGYAEGIRFRGITGPRQ
jgi:hypothetical protein